MTKILLAWFAISLGAIALPVAFVAAVDPFGYFGTNTVGYYYSSERQFKQTLVRTSNYNALAIGDSRIALTDVSLIKLPKYRFLNAGIGGATFSEQIAIFHNSKLDELDLVVFGFTHGTLTVGSNCRDDPAADISIWEPIQFSASWTQIWYAVSALYNKYRGVRPYYRPDGTRDAASKNSEDAGLTEPNADYWQSVRRNTEGTDRLNTQTPYGISWADNCLKLLKDAKALADRKGVRIVVVLMPMNRDLLNAFDWKSWLTSEHSRREFERLRGITPNVVNFLDSPYSESSNFWLHDPTHFKPDVGARLIEEAIRRSEALTSN